MEATFRRDFICSVEDEAEEPSCGDTDRVEFSGKFVQDNAQFLLDVFCCEPTKDLKLDSSLLKAYLFHKKDTRFYQLDYLNLTSFVGYEIIRSPSDDR